MSFTKSYNNSLVSTDTLFTQLGLEKKALQPLSSGDRAPEFSLLTKAAYLPQLPAGQADIIISDDLFNGKPLVISFYSPHWADYGHRHIKLLIEAYPKIKALGGELLVLTSEPAHHIRQIVNYYNLPFNIAQDLKNQIAESFQVFSQDAPVWENVSGIDENVALPATYVVTPNQQIIFDFVSTDFSNIVSVREILTAVYKVRDTEVLKVA